MTNGQQGWEIEEPGIVKRIAKNLKLYINWIDIKVSDFLQKLEWIQLLNE